MSDYTIHHVDSHAFGSGLVNILGSRSDIHCVGTLNDGLIVNNTGYFYNQDSGLFRISGNVNGQLTIQGTTCDKNTAGAAGGTFITAAGTGTLRVVLKGNTFRGRAGSNMTRGFVGNVNATTTTIEDGGGNTWGESVTSTYTAGGATIVGRIPIAGAPIDVVLTSFAGSPESNVIGSPGAFCFDTTNGDTYVKATGTSTNTGWKKNTHA